MELISLISLLGLGLIQQVLAASKVVPLNFRRYRSSTVINSDIAPATLYNDFQHIYYLINITVGTPPQSMTLDLDTGSSDIWMFSPEAMESCHGSCVGAAYYSNQSSTYQPLSQDGPFDITYGDGTQVEGNYFSDVLTVGGVSVSNATMAVATDLLFWDLPGPGIMGIGYDQNEAADRPYPGLLNDMVNQGLINTRAFSLWLNDREASTGTILFGGYDTDKYTGELTTLDNQQTTTGTYSQFEVAWTSLTLSNSTTSICISPSNFSEQTLLDSGTSLSIIPTDMYNSLAEYFGAYVDNTTGLQLVNCDLGQGSLDFGFGGSSSPLVSVPFSELAFPAYYQNTSTPQPVMLSDGTQACSFGLLPAEGLGFYVLGDTFLRSAYVVFDLDDHVIGIAQSNFNSTSSNVVEIHAGNQPFGTAVASATGTEIGRTSTGDELPVNDRNATSAVIASTSLRSHTAATSEVTASLSRSTYETIRSATVSSASSTPSSGASVPKAAGHLLVSTLGAAAAAAAHAVGFWNLVDRVV